MNRINLVFEFVPIFLHVGISVHCPDSPLNSHHILAEELPIERSGHADEVVDNTLNDIIRSLYVSSFIMGALQARAVHKPTRLRRVAPFSHILHRFNAEIMVVMATKSVTMETE